MAGVLEEDLLTDEEALACEAAAQQAEQAFRLSKRGADQASSQEPVAIQQGLLHAAAAVEAERRPARCRDLKANLPPLQSKRPIASLISAVSCSELPAQGCTHVFHVTNGPRADQKFRVCRNACLTWRTLEQCTTEEQPSGAAACL